MLLTWILIHRRWDDRWPWRCLQYPWALNIPGPAKPRCASLLLAGAAGHSNMDFRCQWCGSPHPWHDLPRGATPAEHAARHRNVTSSHRAVSARLIPSSSSSLWSSSSPLLGSTKSSVVHFMGRKRGPLDKIAPNHGNVEFPALARDCS